MPSYGRPTGAVTKTSTPVSLPRQQIQNLPHPAAANNNRTERCGFAGLITGVYNDYRFFVYRFPLWSWPLIVVLTAFMAAWHITCVAVGFVLEPALFFLCDVMCTLVLLIGNINVPLFCR